MTQADLLSWNQGNAEQLERVSSRIAAAILGFLRAKGIGREFHADELRKHVADIAPAAPASADRILRSLRQRGLVGYIVKDRRASLYELTALEAR